MLAIEIAAPALAANTYLVVFHRFDGYAIALAAVTVAMGIVQLGLIPYYRRAPFGPAFWVGSFSYATAATLAMRWINQELPARSRLVAGCHLDRGYRRGRAARARHRAGHRSRSVRSAATAIDCRSSSPLLVTG